MNHARRFGELEQIMELDVDYLAAPSWDEEMDARLVELRENHPLYWSETNGLWVVTRFEDVSRVSKNNQIFCSGGGVRPGNPTKLALIDEDEPRHGQIRKLLNKGFTPRMVKRLERVFLGLVTDAIDQVANKGECDFVESIAVPMPLLLIAEMIGIRKQDRERFHRWSDALIAGDGNFDNPEIMAAAAKAFVEYTTYVREIFEERRQNPQDDLVSVLVNADQEGVIGKLEHHGDVSEHPGVLSAEQRADDELTMLMVLLLVAGNETTRNGISGGMELLIGNPDERQKLIDDPALIPGAVEEMLRLTTPVRSFARTATQGTQLRGQKIEEGQKVLMLYGPANRDPREFENPEVFDVLRNPHHLAFGIGNHFCLGANLARMEMRVAFRELLRRLPEMEFSQGGPVIVPSSLVRTVRTMWVEYTPERQRDLV